MTKFLVLPTLQLKQNKTNNKALFITSAGYKHETSKLHNKMCTNESCTKLLCKKEIQNTLNLKN